MSADRGSVDTANNGLTHTTLQAAPIHISQLRPLPDDILHMKETDTACQYCGISYLLLSKYESMNSHVQKVETEMAELKNYIQERPQMLTRIDLLLARQRELEHDQEVTLAAMLEWQTRSQRDTAEEKLQSHRKTDTTSGRITGVSIIKKYHQPEIWSDSAQSDLAKLKGYFSSCERRNERISAELESYKHDYLTHIDEQHVHTRDLQSNCLELENRLYQANGHIMDLTTEREVLYAEKNKSRLWLI
ncbi:hypothetical protein BASA60_001448 [Batrachochytrium salamandrivorans]|nr:hypothetical protein BASA60_001448 [Batrachochytrium salamandrivorans]